MYVYKYTYPLNLVVSRGGWYVIVKLVFSLYVTEPREKVEQFVHTN